MENKQSVYEDNYDEWEYLNDQGPELKVRGPELKLTLEVKWLLKWITISNIWFIIGLIITLFSITFSPSNIVDPAVLSILVFLIFPLINLSMISKVKRKITVYTRSTHTACFLLSLLTLQIFSIMLNSRLALELAKQEKREKKKAKLS